MKPSIFIFGLIKDVEANYFNIYVEKVKVYQSRSKNKQAGRGFIKNRVSINEHPSVVEDKIKLVMGKSTWLLAKATVVHWSLLSNGKPVLQYLYGLMTNQRDL